ncbi:SDR family NAD(P)-dependent oxidoreductase [Acinetobacter venetianus]|uniref:SDR family NAD(P)-dependent oxidoreductase n=1 Tax=Acinetobacter venetianus TaxID=52133 RepID=UPI0007788A77|nr:SDR family NAD(P)-dependent oxidoreductase [Acinetobacter venetianus]KXZ62231.1 putative oxidoreductase [Acinetobacter venetianus]
MKTVLIVGATSSIAQACIRQWCVLEESLEFILISRNALKSKDLCNDLHVRYPNIVLHQISLDFGQLEKFKQILVNEFERTKIDIALIVQGHMYHDESNLTPDQIIDLIDINCGSVALCLDTIYNRMALQNSGKIGVFSSVAGDRGRKANYLYGATKAFVSTYTEGLQHKIALLKQDISISLIKPGPTATSMTQHLVNQGEKLASVDDVAKMIVVGVEKEKSIIYAPKIWRTIMFIIKKLPFFIFKRLDI